LEIKYQEKSRLKAVLNIIKVKLKLNNIFSKLIPLNSFKKICKNIKENQINIKILRERKVKILLVLLIIYFRV